MQSIIFNKSTWENDCRRNWKTKTNMNTIHFDVYDNKVAIDFMIQQQCLAPQYLYHSKHRNCMAGITPV